MWLLSYLKCRLPDGTVIDSLKYGFGRDDGLTSAVADHESRITVSVDHSGGAIRGVKDGLDSTFIENSLVTAGTFKLSGYILTAFVLGEAIDIVVHDDPLAERLMSGQVESVVDLGKAYQKDDRPVA